MPVHPYQLFWQILLLLGVFGALVISAPWIVN